MDPERGDDPIERYRNAYFRLRGVLHDRNTDLPAYPMLNDTLRSWLEDRRAVGVVHVEAANAGLVESLYGWQIFDRVVARMAATVRECVGRVLPASALLAVDAVPGERVVAFIPADDEGHEVDQAALGRMAAALRARLEEAFDEDDFATLSPRLAIRAGHAFVTLDPFFRFERRVHAAIEEARSLPSRRERGRDRAWRAELEQILRDEMISVLFQPVVSLASEEVLGFEALTRGPKDSALEMPRALFAVSDRVGSAAALDRLCRTTALRASLAALGRGKLFLNIHPACVGDRDWRESAGSVLREFGRGPRDLVLEMSERRIGDEADAVARACGALREEGFGIALDDVGTGYASLLTVETIRPDFLKLDASLVRGIDADLVKQEALASVVRVGERVGAPVVAVGVETRGEADALMAGGASYGQGFLYAGPAPIAAFANPPSKEL